MISINELQKWLSTLSPDNYLAIDDGGLTLLEITADDAATSAFLEIGGVPEEINLDPGMDQNAKNEPLSPVNREHSSQHLQADRPFVLITVKEMITSAGHDFYVSVNIGERELTPNVFKERWKAEYEVAEWQWLLNGGEKPDLWEFDKQARAARLSSDELIKANRTQDEAPHNG